MKVVLQDGMKDCGVCCLLSIIRFYGGDVSKEYLRELTNTTKEGVNLYNLSYAATKLGFISNGVTGKIEQLNVNNLPCIAHININKKLKHFIVIYKIDNDKHQITIMDPAKGKKIISYSEFNMLTSNYYLLLKPYKKLPIFKHKKVIRSNIIEILLNNKKIVLFIFIFTLNYFICTILSSFYFKYLIELSINYNISNNIMYIMMIVGIIYIFKHSLNYFRNNLLNKWNSLLNVSVNEKTYRQILLLPYLYFKNHTTGEIISRFQDLNNVRDFLTILFCTISTDLITVIVFFIIMNKYSYKLSLIVNIHITFICLFLIVINKIKKKKYRKLKQNEDILNSYLIQGISNVDTIKGSHLEKRFIDKFSLRCRKYQEKIYDYKSLVDKEIFIKSVIGDSIFLFIYSFGSFLVINKKLSLSKLLVYQSLINIYLSSFMNILNLISAYHTYKISLNRIEEIYMLENESFINNYFYLPYNLEGDITINKLNYKIGTKILFNNLSIVIKKGEKILLSGSSGCGKSTLVKMLLRYIEIESNIIKISNIDINHYHLQNIRSNITYVTSNEYLFNDTIKNNITLYKEISEEEINKICNFCLVNDNNDENKYLDSLIEENGFNISNGERQRIILARSLLKKSSIYIFDEALAQIDINREKEILENIFKYLKDKTVIVISHRFNNKKLFNRVLKLENGVINEVKKL